jgi:hypothetical protein
MPPGKAFVDMEQLSGGEKTMAALAPSDLYECTNLRIFQAQKGDTPSLKSGTLGEILVYFI